MLELIWMNFLHVFIGSENLIGHLTEFLFVNFLFVKLSCSPHSQTTLP